MASSRRDAVSEATITPIYLEQRYISVRRKLLNILESNYDHRGKIQTTLTEAEELLRTIITYMVAYQEVVIEKYPKALGDLQSVFQKHGSTEDQASLGVAIQTYNHGKLSELLRTRGRNWSDMVMNQSERPNISEMMPLSELNTFQDIPRDDQLKEQMKIIKTLFNKMRHSLQVLKPLVYRGSSMSLILDKVRKVFVGDSELSPIIEDHLEKVQNLEDTILDQIASMTGQGKQTLSIIIGSQVFLRNMEYDLTTKEGQRIYWLPFMYEGRVVNSLGEEETQLCCALRTFPDTLEENGIKVSFLNQVEMDFPLEEGQTLASRIVCIESATSRNVKFKEGFPAGLALPSSVPENCGKTLIMRRKQGNTWKDFGVQKAQALNYKDLDLYECGMDNELSSLTAALVAVVTEEKVFVREEGVTIRSKVDKKVSVIIQPGATDGPTEITTKVVPIKAENIDAIKNQQLGVCLRAISAIVSMKSKRVIRKPTINLHLSRYKTREGSHPNGPENRPESQPATSGDMKTGNSIHTNEGHFSGGARQGGRDSEPNRNKDSRKSSEVGKHGNTKHIIVALKKMAHDWKIESAEPKSQRGNMVHVNLETLSEGVNKLVAFEMEGDCPSEENAIRLAQKIEDGQNKVVARMLVAQKPDDMNSVYVQACPITELKSYLQNMARHKFTEISPPCREMELLEGQKLDIASKGNIKMDVAPMPIVVNSYIASARCILIVNVKDPAEQQLDTVYRGFLHFATVIDHSRQDLDEIPISLPKLQLPEQENTFLEEVFSYVAEHYMKESTDELRSEAASNTGDLFEALAKFWEIPENRLQDINRAPTREQKMKQLLYHWFLTSLQKFDKEEELVDAMQNIGRSDVVQIIEEKKEKHEEANKWRRAFVSLLTSSVLLSNWKFLARELNVEEVDIQVIDSTKDNFREKTFQMLILWRERFGEGATRNSLIRALRKLEQTESAEIFENEMGRD